MDQILIEPIYTKQELFWSLPAIYFMSVSILDQSYDIKIITFQEKELVEPKIYFQ